MLVQEWMTKEVITVSPDTSMMKASRLMKDKKIRRIPVVDEQSRVVGILSDRDIKDASPSKATTLDTHELYYLLSEMKVKDIMTKNPICASEKDSVEGVALIMMENRFGGMPVVDANKKIVGILTDSDIFKVLVTITGVTSGGMQVVFDLPNTRGTLRPIVEMLRENEVGIVSILTAQEENDDSKRRVYIRLSPTPEGQQDKLVEQLKNKFPSFQYCEAAFKRS